MDKFCMGCGGMVNEGAACPEPGKPGCVKAHPLSMPTPPTQAKQKRKKGSR